MKRKISFKLKTCLVVLRNWSVILNYRCLTRQLLIGFCICYAASGYAQNDTITLTTGKTLYGEIKNIKSKVLTLKTSYSDSDFKIDFKKVSKLNIQRRCFVLLTKGRRRTGYIKSRKENITFLIKYLNVI